MWNSTLEKIMVMELMLIDKILTIIIIFCNNKLF